MPLRRGEKEVRRMPANEVFAKVNTEALDESIEKATQLLSLLQEIQKLAESLFSNGLKS